MTGVSKIEQSRQWPGLRHGSSTTPARSLSSVCTAVLFCSVVPASSTDHVIFFVSYLCCVVLIQSLAATLMCVYVKNLHIVGCPRDAGFLQLLCLMLNVSVTSDSGEMTSDNVLPIHRVSFLSIMTFHWISGFMWRIYRKGYATLDMMWKCCEEESATFNGRRQDRSFAYLLSIFSSLTGNHLHG